MDYVVNNYVNHRFFFLKLPWWPSGQSGWRWNVPVVGSILLCSRAAAKKDIPISWDLVLSQPKNLTSGGSFPMYPTVLIDQTVETNKIALHSLFFSQDESSIRFRSICLVYLNNSTTTMALLSVYTAYVVIHPWSLELILVSNADSLSFPACFSRGLLTCRAWFSWDFFFVEHGQGMSELSNLAFNNSTTRAEHPCVDQETVKILFAARIKYLLHSHRRKGLATVLGTSRSTSLGCSA